MATITMHFIDYTHPERIPPQFMAHDRRSKEFYLRLDELPKGHPMYSPDWILFRHPEWLEGGSAWVQAGAIARDLERLIEDQDLHHLDVTPVIGSQDPGFDEALGQGLVILGYRPRILEFSAAPETAIA